MSRRNLVLPFGITDYKVLEMDDKPGYFYAQVEFHGEWIEVMDRISKNDTVLYVTNNVRDVSALHNFLRNRVKKVYHYLDQFIYDIEVEVNEDATAYVISYNEVSWDHAVKYFETKYEYKEQAEEWIARYVYKKWQKSLSLEEILALEYKAYDKYNGSYQQRSDKLIELIGRYLYDASGDGTRGNISYHKGDSDLLRDINEELFNLKFRDGDAYHTPSSSGYVIVPTSPNSSNQQVFYNLGMGFNLLEGEEYDLPPGELRTKLITSEVMKNNDAINQLSNINSYLINHLRKGRD